MSTASAVRSRQGGGSVRPEPLPLGARHWIAAWAASPQAPAPTAKHARGFANVTVRNIVFVSAGGTLARVRLTNAFGRRPLKIGRAAIAVSEGGAAEVPGTNVPLTFSGKRSVVIPAGTEAISDPVHFSLHPLERLALSVFLPRPTGPPTQHTQAQQVNYLSAGNHALDTAPSAFTTELRSWYFVAGVDVKDSRHDPGTIVALGDSITDGIGSRADANARWPNDLARRLDALPGASLSVVDEGVGGNRVLRGTACCGVSALARFGRDVLRQPAVRAVIILEGINDIDHSAATAPGSIISGRRIIAGYRTLIARAHAAGLKIFGATLTPFGGSGHWTPDRERERDAINRWIRTSGAFDGVVDFAAAVADPRRPLRLRPAYDSGDHLHPNDAGYHAMADAVDLAMLVHAVGV